MRVVMAELGRLELISDGEDPASEFRPAYCGLCHTDAKMLFEGQRDLSLPRVPGHEAVYRRVSDGSFHVPWPARSCGHCAFCASGRENLCEAIRIMGFHFDGAYSQGPSPESLAFFPLPGGLEPALGCFAEPYGCVLHPPSSSTAGAYWA
jgi:D-arabinose 1-dehydrogenase-like Zn-dependent alcohol dehydrogenase